MGDIVCSPKNPIFVGRSSPCLPLQSSETVGFHLIRVWWIFGPRAVVV